MLIYQLLFSAFFVFAQDVGVSVDRVSSDDQNETVINIQKKPKSEKHTQITSTDAILEGDSSPLKKDARQSWKKACQDWKQEIKELNGKNVIALDCGQPQCSQGSTIEFTCSSSARAKIKIVSE